MLLIPALDSVFMIIAIGLSASFWLVFAWNAARSWSNGLVLLELPTVLLVEKNSGIKSAEELWRRDKISEPLICLPAAESLSKKFQEELQKCGVDWFPSIEASSTDLVEAYVANGLGIGVSAAIPRKISPAKVRTLPLEGFPPVVVGAMWRGRKTPLIEIFLAEAQKRAKQIV